MEQLKRLRITEKVTRFGSYAFGLACVATLGFSLGYANRSQEHVKGLSAATCFLFAAGICRKISDISIESQDLLCEILKLEAARAEAVNISEPEVDSSRPSSDGSEWLTNGYLNLVDPTISKQCKTCQYYNEEAKGYLDHPCAIHPSGKPSEDCLDWSKKKQRYYVIQIRGGTHGGFYLAGEFLSNRIPLGDRHTRSVIAKAVGVDNINQAVGKSIEVDAEFAHQAIEFMFSKVRFE